MFKRGAAAALCAAYALLLLALCYYLPFSQLYSHIHSYDSLAKQVETEKDARSVKAKRYFSSIKSQESVSLYNSRLHKNLTFVVGIITVQRNKEGTTHGSYGYLLQSASLLDQMLKMHPLFNNSVPFVCNVDARPQNHQDAVSIYQFMPYTERYGLNSLGLAPVMIPDTNMSFAGQVYHPSKYRKESIDYAFCLLSAAALKPQFVILVEEDALAHKDFPLVLEHLLETRLKSSNQKFAFLKLFFPAKWQGFGFEVIRVLDLASMSVVGGSILALVYLFYKIIQRQSCYRLSRIFLAGCLITMVSCWLIGRQGVNELRRVSKHFYRLQTSEGCCTQAMLYPIYVVYNLSRYMTSNVVSYRTDLAIFDFASLARLRTYQVEPSLFLHVGFHSTLPSPQKHPEEFIHNV
ncbi:hypothetical protein BsWGS_14543 [Bradybaena similaris]